MTLSFDFYFSFRSPYSYLSTPQVEELIARYDIAPRMRFVLPIAVRIQGFFKQVSPLWPPYLLRDTFRISQMHNVPYRWPRPDPIVMDYAAGEVAAEQPYIYRVTRMGVKAKTVITGLFHTYFEEPRQMPPHVHAHIERGEDKARVIADYVAGMTDRFALDEYKKLFDPLEKV